MSIEKFLNIARKYSLGLLLALVLGFLMACLGVCFLHAMQWAYRTRCEYHFLVYLLPICGFSIGYLYHTWGKEIVGGTNLVIEQIRKPNTIISWLMIPFIFLSTIASHLFGASVGREGTAVQMGASLADQFSNLFHLPKNHRKILLKCGVAAGFASVFGTPVAGIVFAYEFAKVGKINLKGVFMVVSSAFSASFFTYLLGATHTHYIIGPVPQLNFIHFSWAILAGIAFGLCGLTFNLALKYSTLVFSKIPYPPLRPFVGALVFVSIVCLVGWQNTERFHGLGLEYIVSSFDQKIATYDFLAKLTLTALVLGAGLKGGEVTPIFYIGATLGNSLSNVIPLPMGLLAAMGFVAVFTACANTPFATILMALELFGSKGSCYFVIACVIAYLISGKIGIYESQLDCNTKRL